MTGYGIVKDDSGKMTGYGIVKDDSG